MLIVLAEVLQGALRVRFLNRRVGDHRARQLGVFTGSGLILVIAWFGMPWIGGRTVADLLEVGLLWLGLMLALDVAFGGWVFLASWRRIAADFDVRRGGLLGIGMFVLLVAPLVTATVRRCL